MRSLRRPLSLHTPARYLRQRFDDDAPRHLRGALATFGEHDRDLRDLEAEYPGSPGHLDLERVALGAELVQRNRLEQGPPVATEPARRVGQGESEQQLRVGGAGPR